MPPSFELDDRRYLREKVVVTYEALWRGEPLDEKAWDELFFLKVNAGWIEAAIASLSAAQLRAQQPIIRRLFDECCKRLDEVTESSAVSHALETLSGMFLGLGGRRAHTHARAGRAGHDCVAPFALRAPVRARVCVDPSTTFRPTWWSCSAASTAPTPCLRRCEKGTRERSQPPARIPCLLLF
eukprot:4017575-Prymnesium_polylepis.1